MPLDILPPCIHWLCRPLAPTVDLTDEVKASVDLEQGVWAVVVPEFDTAEDSRVMGKHAVVSPGKLMKGTIVIQRQTALEGALSKTGKSKWTCGVCLGSIGPRFTVMKCAGRRIWTSPLSHDCDSVSSLYNMEEKSSFARPSMARSRANRAGTRLLTDHVFLDQILQEMVAKANVFGSTMRGGSWRRPDDALIRNCASVNRLDVICCHAQCLWCSNVMTFAHSPGVAVADDVDAKDEAQFALVRHLERALDGLSDFIELRALTETKILNETMQLFVPLTRSLLEAIEGLLESTDLSFFARLYECCFDIKLFGLKVKERDDGTKNSEGLKSKYRCKGVREINSSDL
ncbi:hypothetical protein Ae201684P_014042 [Aphanomyces euteiches]|nr:hypothetical protein Ae201684P_014042 [Aphanomyces euteiches]